MPAEEQSSLWENQGGQHNLEWQDTVKGLCGGSYQVSLGGNTDKSVLLLYKKITSLMVEMMKVYWCPDGVNQLLSTRWCWDQKWLDVRMSKSSSTEVCESRKAMCLTSSKGSMTARVTSSFIVIECFGINNWFFCPKEKLINKKQAKVLPTLQNNTVMLL